MSSRIRGSRGYQGFTLLEVMITVIILGVLSSIAVPAFLVWLPDYRLRSAASDLYSNMQLAKMMAIGSNKKCWMIFDPDGSGSYEIRGPDGTPEKRVDFLDYDPDGNIGYGRGNATRNATTSGGPIQEDFISYRYNKATFNPCGMGSFGYVYLSNDRGTAYAVGTWFAGVIVLKKWNDTINSWE